MTAATALQQQTAQLALRDSASIMERVIIAGDLSQLQPAERVQYYNAVCESVGLNPFTKPFEYIELNGKLTLYALKTTTDQLRQINRVSVTIVSREKLGDAYVVTARATTPDGRTDESIGAVPLAKEDGEWKQGQSGKRFFAKNGKTIPLAGEDYTNALMKAETKAKRRVTLSICGLGWLDESEVASVASARPVTVDTATGEIQKEVRPAALATPVTPPPSTELPSEIRRMWAEARPHIDEHAYAAKYPNWRTEPAQAASLREDLKTVLGNRGSAAPVEQPQEQPATAQADVMMTDAQRKALMGHAGRAGAKQSAERYCLWAYMLNQDAQRETKSLTETEAETLLGLFSPLSNDELAQALVEAKQKVLAF